MSFSYQYGANPTIDFVRLLVGDTVNVGHIWEDSEIMAGYAIDVAFAIVPMNGMTATNYGGSPPSYRRVAATLLDGLASNRGRLAGALQVLDIKLDVGKAAVELRAQAQSFRDIEDNAGHFAIAEMVNDPQQARERVWKQWLRLFGS